MSLVNDWIGITHLIAAVVTLICGTLVLAMNKGTRRHQQVGYVYAVSILVVVITAFGIYRLFRGFGPFHAFALVAIFSLALGMILMFKKERTAKAIKTHYSRMYWSVMGLYAAFTAETLVRLPSAPFWEVVIASISGIMIEGGLLFRKYTPVWKNRFNRKI